MSKTRPVQLTVLRAEQIGPTMRRVVLGGDGFDTYLERHRALPEAWTDTYVKLVFAPPGTTYPADLDLETLPERPTLRTYTIRSVDAEAREVAIDFVVHGDEGLAGPWAQRARPGDTIHLRGPNGAYRPRPDADWHLFVGDEAGLPAISASIEALPAGSRAVAFIEVDGPADEVQWTTDADVEAHWLLRAPAPPGSTTLLDDAVRAWAWPGGRCQAFVHGESALLKSVRPYLLDERGVARADISVSAYWRRGTNEEGFRTWKSEQRDAVVRPGGS
jgi:NADPH-dependent ferric siderophore reductase